MTLKVQILQTLRRLFIILVSMTMTLFSEKVLISNKCIGGLMSNLIKKSWTDSSCEVCRDKVDFEIALEYGRVILWWVSTTPFGFPFCLLFLYYRIFFVDESTFWNPSDVFIFHIISQYFQSILIF